MIFHGGVGIFNGQHSVGQCNKKAILESLDFLITEKIIHMEKISYKVSVKYCKAVALCTLMSVFNLFSSNLNIFLK